MCRHASFPKGTTRKEALKIMDDMEYGYNGKNRDGFGYSYVNDDGKLVTKKWALPFSEIMKRKMGNDIFDHMPHNGWTIAHMRAMSCGAITKDNTHPFNIGNWSITHNGLFRHHGLVALSLDNFIDLKGTTDSEVAANVINMISPKRFALSYDIEEAGTYLCLNQNGSLEVINISGDLYLFENMDNNNRIIFSSQFAYNDYKDKQLANRGWYKFDADGVLKGFEKREYKSSTNHWINGGGSFRAASRSAHFFSHEMSDF